MHGRKILFIGEYTGFAGGIERYAFQTAGILRRHGARVEWCGSRPARDAEKFARGFDAVIAPEAAAASGFDFAVVHRAADTALPEQLLREHRDKLALIVHDHEYYCPRTYRYTPFGRRDCFRPYSMLRCGLCAMAVSPRRWRNGFFRELAARTTQCAKRLKLLRHIPRTAVLSKFMRNNLISNGFFPERVAVIPPPIPFPDPLPEHVEETPARLLFTGQLIRGKGVELLLRALPLVRQDWQLTVAGDGNMRPELERLAGELGIAGKVRFAGWVADPERLYERSDIAVLPFFWQEPFGLVGPEAAAHALPVVAFRTGGADEWLIDGKTGIAVPPRDVEKFAAALDKLLENRELRQRLGNRGRELVRSKFSETEFVANFRAWMDDVPGGGR